MPTYAYVCKDCAHAFDVQQSFSDDSLTTCPECGGTLRKQFGAVGVVFKGSGFYKTDSREAGRKSTSSSASSAGSTAAKDSGSGKDAAASSSGAASGDSAKSATGSSGSKSSTGSSDGSAA